MLRIGTAHRFLLGGLLLMLAVFAVVAVFANEQKPGAAPPGSQDREPPPASQGREYLIQVDSVDVLIRESYPVQVVAAIEGVVGDGCTRLERVEQSREENRILVRIVGYHSGGPVCTMIARLYRDTIRLEGPFNAGDYVLDVNSVIREFSVS